MMDAKQLAIYEDILKKIYPLGKQVFFQRLNFRKQPVWCKGTVTQVLSDGMIGLLEWTTTKRKGSEGHDVFEFTLQHPDDLIDAPSVN
jgi:hypothetical protein